MTSKYLYMKFLGLLLVILGFSYSITSFNNFFSFIFKTKIFNENLNIFLVSCGLILPIYIFIFGIYFYFYVDYNPKKINKYILTNYIIFIIISVIIVIFKEINLLNNILIFQIFEFVHISFSPCLFILSLLGLCSCIKYKY